MRKYLIILVLIFVVFFALSVCLPKNLPSQEGVLFDIKKGEGSKNIAFNLKKDGLIWCGSCFRAYVLIMGISDKLQAGTYKISPSMNIISMAKMFAVGDVAKETITIIEGWNLKDIAWYFENKGMFQAEELFELNDLSWISGFEGYLFPDTYQVNIGESLEEIVGRMQDNFDKKTAGIEAEIAKQGKTLFEIITMASLIEKEVRTKEDKQIVSGVLWKRLGAGVPLQVDATITYITGQKSTKVSMEDTKIDSPYNTYMYYGLPAGPICNPGLESIEAAIYPEDSLYWYYLSTIEGQTIFSKTLEEHNIAKAKYLK